LGTLGIFWRKNDELKPLIPDICVFTRIYKIASYEYEILKINKEIILMKYRNVERQKRKTEKMIKVLSQKET